LLVVCKGHKQPPVLAMQQPRQQLQPGCLEELFETHV